MEIYRIPELFRNTQGFYPLEASAGGIKLYHSEVDTIKANVQLTHNLLVFVLEGRKRIYHRDGVYEVNAFEGAFLKKGSYLMSEKRSADNHYKAVLFCFNQEVAHEAISVPHAKPSAGSVHFINHTASLETLLTKVVLQLSTSQIEDTSVLTKNSVSQLLVHICKTDALLANIIAEQTEDHDKALRDVMDNHFTEALPLQQLAFLSGHSLASFKRQAEKLLGTSPHRWIRNKRLELARQLVESGETAIADIGYAVGYINTSHFIKLFKEAFGQTPQALRQIKAIKEI